MWCYYEIMNKRFIFINIVNIIINMLFFSKYLYVNFIKEYFKSIFRYVCNINFIVKVKK